MLTKREADALKAAINSSEILKSLDGKRAELHAVVTREAATDGVTDAIKKFLHSSLSPVAYRYDLLTDQERSLMSEEQFGALVCWLGPIDNYPGLKEFVEPFRPTIPPEPGSPEPSWNQPDAFENPER